MKKFIAGFLACLMLVTFVSASEFYSAQKATFKIFVNGVEKTDWGDMSPMVISGRTVLPLKALGDTLGVEVKWDAENKRVIVGQDPLPPIEYKGEMSSYGEIHIKVSGIIMNYGGLRVHHFEFTNICDRDIAYDPNLVRCNSGSTYGGFDIEGLKALKKGVLEPGKSVKGIIAFSNSSVNTNTPIFYYKNSEVQITD